MREERVTCIEGHLEERRAELREHLAQHLESLARRLREHSGEPVGVAAVVLWGDGTWHTELCYGDGIRGLALSASLNALAHSIVEGGEP